MNIFQTIASLDGNKTSEGKPLRFKSQAEYNVNDIMSNNVSDNDNDNRHTVSLMHLDAWKYSDCILFAPNWDVFNFILGD